LRNTMMNPLREGVRTGWCCWPTHCPSHTPQAKELIVPVKKDACGQRSVEVEVEVPGLPEEVCRAIAAGKGISSWFVPSTSEERVGGAAVSNFGPGMEAKATIKTWDPPQKFVTESEEGPLKIATEWIVEARGGGTCVVRVLHRWFAST